MRFCLVALLLAAVVPAESWRLAFGSCHHQDLPAPALLAAAQLRPDAFVWLGGKCAFLLNSVCRQHCLS